ncbi:type VI secretion system-associated FHA domain protein TagH [Acetobacter sp.]|jgi:type VI secretion system FHA domain protein|uniref:type VI secretion system-associated FHA domain protein TagH n=1 Tax=Acetobacter sp. TaxID=440 RepID=UPI0025C0661A|nr:type VI secretion system-associated FHA domain protein TagH [Acetobacter sp.]MCH4092646.1 type VI secretion system-associated FHA domain protein TagH [Acetobacter sp.]MCI1299780.1 type VI secretion system-associated FHA domain protein TagH [Acetobacter sp.]MCI1315340.1 type VI secretion system-associated FHA domain protein TagH [Acetobacter sp.]
MTTLTLKAIAAPDGASAENRTVTGRKFTIGRDPVCDLCLSDTSRILSKKHCFIERQGESWNLVDTSTNGTFVNQDTTPLRRASRELRNGDAVEIGGYRFEIVIGDDEPLSPPVVAPHVLPATRYEDERPIGSVFSPSEPEGADGVADMAEVDPFLSQDVSINVHPQADDTPVMHDPGLLHMPCVPPRVIPEIIGDDWDQEPELSASGPASKPEPEPPEALPIEESPTPLPLQDNPFATVDTLPDLLPDENHDRDEAALPEEDTSFHEHAEPLITAFPRQSHAVEERTPPQSSELSHQDDDGVFGSHGGHEDLLGPFLYGAGLHGMEARDFTPDTMEELGRTFRAMIHGLRQIMIARATIKGEFRIEQTMIQASGNNPLKFSANDDDALLALIGVGRNSGMLPSDAISETLNDMRLHEFAVLRAMQDAIGALLTRLEPERFREDAESRFLDFLPDNHNGRAFRLFEERYRRTREALSDDFDSAFGKAFARAYEKAIVKADIALQRTDPHAKTRPNGDHS